MEIKTKKREKCKPLESDKDKAENVLVEYFSTIKKTFLKFENWLKLMRDPRIESKCEYSLRIMLYMSILLMSPPVKSRHHYTELYRNTEAASVFGKVLNEELLKIPDEDSLAYLWNKLKVFELEELKLKMVKRLLRMRCLEMFKFGNRYLIAVDGTELYRFKSRHCKHCLYAKINGVYQYYHRVLEAKLICSNGMVFSIATEFIENSPDSEDNKQDCELKAFHRVEKKVKEMFPRLAITILADGLYPNGPVFAKCESNHWKYIFTLKDDVLKTVWEDFNGLFVQEKTAIGGKLEQPEIYDKKIRYRWQNDLAYQGKDFKGKLSVLQKAELNDKQEYETNRAFITNYRLKDKNIFEIETAGQKRVKIENEGFNIQKNHGYQLEHVYTESPNGMKVVYIFIQIAHLILQLVIFADILKVFRKLSSLREFFEKFVFAIKIGWTESLDKKFSEIDDKKFQLRFDSS